MHLALGALGVLPKFSLGALGNMPVLGSLMHFAEKAAGTLANIAGPGGFLPFPELGRMAYSDLYPRNESDAARFFLAHPQLTQAVQNHQNRQGFYAGQQGPGFQAQGSGGFGGGGFGAGGCGEPRMNGLCGDSLQAMCGGGFRGYPGMQAPAQCGFPCEPSQQPDSNYFGHARNIAEEIDKLPANERAGSMLGKLTTIANGSGPASQSARDMLSNPEWMSKLTGGDGDFDLNDLRRSTVTPQDSADARLIFDHLKRGMPLPIEIRMDKGRMQSMADSPNTPQDVKDAFQRLKDNGGYDMIERIKPGQGADGVMSLQDLDLGAKVNGA